MYSWGPPSIDIYQSARISLRDHITADDPYTHPGMHQLRRVWTVAPLSRRVLVLLLLLLSCCCYVAEVRRSLLQQLPATVVPLCCRSC